MTPLSQRLREDSSNKTPLSSKYAALLFLFSLVVSSTHCGLSLGLSVSRTAAPSKRSRVIGQTSRFAPPERDEFHRAVRPLRSGQRCEEQHAKEGGEGKSLSFFPPQDALPCEGRLIISRLSAPLLLCLINAGCSFNRANFRCALH